MMENIKAWITKYALTDGVFEIEAELSNVSDNMICEKRKDNSFYSNRYFHGEGKEWHRTKESALQKAEQMRIKKIENLKKQIAKFEKMKFEN